jgi:hypothetical protein
VRELSPRAETFRGHGFRIPGWVFRGRSIHVPTACADSLDAGTVLPEHVIPDLVPSALRPTEGTLELLGIDSHALEQVTNKEQFLAEATLLHEFFLVADAHGLPLPEDSQGLRKILRTQVRDADVGSIDGKTSWPPHNLLSLMGLAQHYGLPTRLLDWTRYPYVAAYFAAIGAMEELQKSKVPNCEQQDLVVWALDTDALDVKGSFGFVGYDDKDFPVEVVTAPSAGNPNLHAQSGLFTHCVAGEVANDAKVDRRSLDRVIADNSPGLGASAVLTYFTLPVVHAAELLWWLAKEGVTAARLYPGYHGVSKTMRECRLWRIPEPQRKEGKVDA